MKKLIRKTVLLAFTLLTITTACGSNEIAPEKKPTPKPNTTPIEEGVKYVGIIRKTKRSEKIKRSVLSRKTKCSF